MAEQEAQGLDLRWDRLPDGRFYIAVVAVAQHKGEGIMIPVRTWVLTKAEEEKLKATLAGFIVAKDVPALVH